LYVTIAQTLQHSNTMANTNVHKTNYHTDKTQAYIQGVPEKIAQSLSCYYF